MARAASRRAPWAACALALLACAPSGGAGTSPPSPVSISADSAQFAAIVRSERSLAGSGSFSVNPAPLVTDARVTDPRGVDGASSMRNLTNVRRRILDSEGVRATKDASAGKCNVGSLPAPPNGACPTPLEIRVIAGTSRPGGAYYPSSGIDDRESGTLAGHRAVRVIVTSLGHGGAETAAYDYVFKFEGEAWQIVARKNVSHID